MKTTVDIPGRRIEGCHSLYPGEDQARTRVPLEPFMRIDIDEKLMAEAMKVTGAQTRTEAVELGLKALVGLKKQGRICACRGKLRWTGELARMRRD